LQNISLYYNNIFAFHMHIFIVYALILHIFNMPIHWNTKFMVISSNQNIPFIIKNSKNKIAIHFIICWCYKQFTQQYEHNIHCKSMCISIVLQNLNQNIVESHVLLKKILKQVKSIVYLNIICGFLLTSIYRSS